MKKIFTLISTIAATLGGFNSFSQCPVGQVMVTCDVSTDAWGYECFWDVTPTGNGCGNGAFFTGGNALEVGCAGGGLTVATAGNGYADNTITTETLGCAPIGICVDITYVDDFGDGGASFTIYFDGVAQPTLVGAGTGNVWSMCVAAPPVNDVDMVVAPYEYTKVPLSQVGNIVNGGTITALGTGAVTGATMSVNVLLGATSVFTGTSVAQNIAAFGTANCTVPGGFTPTAIGVYTVNYTSDIIEVDEVLTNNTASYTFEVTDSTYARDNGIVAGPMGIGAGEVGYLGNSFTITNATGQYMTSADVLITNGIGDITGNAFGVEVFSTDAMGTPVASVAMGTGTIGAGVDQWYNVVFTPALTLSAGKYVVCLREDIAYQQQVGTTPSNFTPGTAWASWTSQPWQNTELFGPQFSFAFMIRANVHGFLNVTENTETALNVYPNPAQSELNVSAIEAGSSITVYNNVGQVVLSTIATSNLTTLNVSNFEAGIYTVKSINGSTVGVAKFVKK